MPSCRQGAVMRLMRCGVRAGACAAAAVGSRDSAGTRGQRCPSPARRAAELLVATSRCQNSAHAVASAAAAQLIPQPSPWNTVAPQHGCTTSRTLSHRGASQPIPTAHPSRR